MGRLSVLLAKLVLGLVGMALLTAASLFVVAAFLATWPILRLPPRQRQLRAGLDFAAAGAALFAAFAELRPEPDADDDDSPAADRRRRESRA